MQKLFKMALATIMVAAPLAGAQARDDYRHPHHSPRGPGMSHESARYPKGWGPHRGPDRPGYYHGYQGYRDARPGYRRGNDGYWYPGAAFALGALIGGVLGH